VNDLPTRGEAGGSRADAHLAVAACLGVCLLAGTVLSGGLSAGPPFPAAVRAPMADREAGMPEIRGRVPAAVPAPAGRGADPTGSGQAPPSRALDINRADAADLQALPGIGPVLGRRIVAHREAHGPFRDPADLRHVSGLGATRFARLRGLIRTAEAP
jgi:competence ComEA-like helix-hairpin-helix protein